MHIVLKTKIQRTAAILLLLSIATVLLFLYHQYKIGIVGIIIIFILAVQFKRLLPEELILYSLKKNAGRMTKQEITDQISQTAERTMKRMMQKGIIKTEGEYIVLSDLNLLSAFEERNKN